MENSEMLTFRDESLGGHAAHAVVRLASLSGPPRQFAIDPQPRSIGYGRGTTTELNCFFASENPGDVVGLQGDQVIVCRHVNIPSPRLTLQIVPVLGSLRV